MPKIYQKIEQYNCPIINRVIYPLFILNEFIDFRESIRIFSIFFTFLKILKIFFKMNVSSRILDMFLYQDSMSHTRIFLWDYNLNFGQKR